MAGYQIKGNEVRPDSTRLADIMNFPSPHNVSTVRSWLGLVNQMGSFLPDLAHLTTETRKLLKKGIAFLWSEDHEKEFCKLKDVLAKEHSLHTFNPDLTTELLTDASRLYGIGYALVQINEVGRRIIVQCGSRALTSAESRYATIELECLAIMWATKKCKHFLQAMPRYKVITDHRPLLGIFEKPLFEVDNSRLQRFREALAEYNFEIKWVQGKNHQIADALSRHPKFEANTLQPDLGIELAMITYNELDTIADSDGTYSQICEALIKGKNVNDLPPTHPAKAYKNIWGDLAVNGNLIKFNDRIVVPESARERILEAAHSSHAGISKTRELCRQIYFWPKMADDIKNKINNCELCQKFSPSSPSEPILQEFADYAFQKISLDLADYEGNQYLILVDRFSGYPFIQKLRSTVTSAIITILTSWFWDYGYPQKIKTDGGPQFREEFKEFCRAYGIKHEISSPYNPASNGLAENAVKQLKSLLKKNSSPTEFRRSLLQWRNTPRADGLSPAQLFFGRRQRTELPGNDEIYHPLDMKKASMTRLQSSKLSRERLQNGRINLGLLKTNDQVYIQNTQSGQWDKKGTIIRVLRNNRSYLVQQGNKQIIRNRKFLRLCNNNNRVVEKTETNNQVPILRRSERLKLKYGT